MTQPRIAAFARLANGNAAAVRTIEGQATKLSRTMHGIVYDAVRDEIVVPNPFAAAVLTFRGGASGAEAPIRVIQGPRTQLVGPHSVTLDPTNRELYVADPSRKAVIVFPWDATGNVPPLRIIEGPHTNLSYVAGIGIDTGRNLIAVASYLQRASSSEEFPSAIFFFDRRDNGDVTPRGVLGGQRTGLTFPFQLLMHEGRVIVSGLNTPFVPPYTGDRPRVGMTDVPTTPWRSDTLGFVGVWDAADRGDTPPLAVIRGAASGLIHPSGLAANPQRGEIYVTDSNRNGYFAYLVPEFFTVRRRPDATR